MRRFGKAAKRILSENYFSKHVGSPTFRSGNIHGCANDEKCGRHSEDDEGDHDLKAQPAPGRMANNCSFLWTGFWSGWTELKVESQFSSFQFTELTGSVRFSENLTELLAD